MHVLPAAYPNLSPAGGALQRGGGAFQAFVLTPVHAPGRQADDGHGHGAPKTRKPWQSLAMAAGFLTAAILLRRLPARPSSIALFSTDWKDWAKLGLGVAALNRFNDALNWRPPIWLNAMQTVAVVSPLMMGIRKPALVQMAVLAPLIGALVQGTHMISGKAEGWLEDKAGIPGLITRFAISACMILLGLRTLPPILNQVNTAGKEGMLGKNLAAEFKKAEAKTLAARTQTAGIGAICVRCGGAHAVCMSEIGDFLGALGNWFHHKSVGKS